MPHMFILEIKNRYPKRIKRFGADNMLNPVEKKIIILVKPLISFVDRII